MNNKFKVYKTTKIGLGYITTINPNAYNVKDELTDKVIAMKMIKSDNNGISTYEPLDELSTYYKLNEVKPISTLQKKKTKVITENQINSIINGTK